MPSTQSASHVRQQVEMASGGARETDSKYLAFDFLKFQEKQKIASWSNNKYHIYLHQKEERWVCPHSEGTKVIQII